MSGLTRALLEAVAGRDALQRIDRAILIPVLSDAPDVSRAAVAAALTALLFDDLISRVPEGRAYVASQVDLGRRVCFDHGALRTVCGPTGSLPSGDAAFARLLEPLGFVRTGVYPLERLRMTGRVFTHADAPEQIAQFFVSELHVDAFSPAFQAAAASIMATCVDPLTPWASTCLERLRRDCSISFADAVRLLPTLLRCFGRQHDEPTLVDYTTVLRESAEMAWIATEGNVFNHATDRVTDIRAVEREQRSLGRSIKPRIEVSGSGRVLQTAFKAATVTRRFRTPEGYVQREVPGSFYEFIQRGTLDGGCLDLAFDSMNATGIFQMTAVEV